MNDLLKELNRQKDHNSLMHAEVERLEMTLRHSKQHQLEDSTYQKVLAETTQMYEKKIGELMKQLEDERARSESAEEQLDVMKKLLSDQQKLMQDDQMGSSTYQKALADTTQMYEKKIAELIQQLEDEHALYEGSEEQSQEQIEIEELRLRLQEMTLLYKASTEELQSLRSEHKDLLAEKAMLNEELRSVRQKLLLEEKRKKATENEVISIKKIVPESDFEDKRSYMEENIVRGSSAFSTPLGLHKTNKSRETISGQRTTIAKIFGIQKILALLTSGDLDVQIHAVKVVANLAAEDVNQEKIVEEGGLEALLMLLRSSQNTTILRVASGAIANLAMNGTPGLYLLSCSMK
ncbi:hypothetical protein RJ639_042381 [Escallonia herrerae]|uniref:Vacuolar protein 8 n=1 Tax=Escallonia herrerae TaxID=1293975 RepID=A0AA88WFA5_9ASTE|nr:hypothetical protein RJ639_042381 [Escallonia herrerae]